MNRLAYDIAAALRATRPVNGEFQAARQWNLTVIAVSEALFTHTLVLAADFRSASAEFIAASGGLTDA